MAFGNPYRVTLVCVDDYTNGVMSGSFYNPYFEKSVCFTSTIDFLKKVEDLLEKMNFPQSFSVNRTFQPAQEISLEYADVPTNGKLATFSLLILFRQNASWQGSVMWKEGKREESFRSALELLFLMDSALQK